MMNGGGRGEGKDRLLAQIHLVAQLVVRAHIDSSSDATAIICQRHVTERVNNSLPSSLSQWISNIITGHTRTTN